MKNLLFILTLLCLVILSSCGDDDEFNFTPTNKVGFVTSNTNVTEIQAEDSITIELLVNPATASSVTVSINSDELVYGEDFTTVPAASSASFTLQVGAGGTASFVFVGSGLNITRDNTIVFTITGATGVELGQSAVVSHSLNIERIFLFKEDFNDCESSFPTGWTIFSEASNANWECSDNLRGASGESGDYAASIYGVGADVASADWLISPVINLEDDIDYVVQFASIKRFEGPDLQILISNDYTGSGDPNTATWLNFSAAEAALDEEIDFDYEASGEITIPLSGSVYIAFYYETTGTAIGEGSNYRIDNFKVKQGGGFDGGTGVGIPISEARTQDGQTVTISGVVTTPDYGFNDGQFFVQDGSAGINIFWTDNQGAVSLGDVVEITGTIGAFNDQVQISPDELNIVSSGSQLPTPTVISGADLSVDSDLQGSIISLSGVTLDDASEWPTDPISSGSGASVMATVDGVSFEIRIDRGESFYDGSSAPSGAFTLVGVLGRFRGTVQLLPFLEGQIVD